MADITSLSSASYSPLAVTSSASTSNAANVKKAEQTQSTTQDTTYTNSRDDDKFDVVATSEYGDTFELSAEGEAALALGDITSFNFEVRTPPSPPERQTDFNITEDKEAISDSDEETDAAIEEESDTTSATISSNLAVYSESQLEQMYLKGEISRQDYESEVAVKEEIKEASYANNKEFSEDMTTYNDIAEDSTRIGEAINTAYSDDSSDTVDVSLRMQAMQTLENIQI